MDNICRNTFSEGKRFGGGGLGGKASPKSMVDEVGELDIPA